jgi:hypothetical protein
MIPSSGEAAAGANMSLSERLMHLAHAGEVAHPCDVIWTPDRFPLDVVASAVEAVLTMPDAISRDVHQATYLLTTFRLLR